MHHHTIMASPDTDTSRTSAWARGTGTTLRTKIRGSGQSIRLPGVGASSRWSERRDLQHISGGSYKKQHLSPKQISFWANRNIFKCTRSFSSHTMLRGASTFRSHPRTGTNSQPAFQSPCRLHHPLFTIVDYSRSRLGPQRTLGAVHLMALYGQFHF